MYSKKQIQKAISSIIGAPEEQQEIKSLDFLEQIRMIYKHLEWTYGEKSIVEYAILEKIQLKTVNLTSGHYNDIDFSQLDAECLLIDGAVFRNCKFSNNALLARYNDVKFVRCDFTDVSVDKIPVQNTFNPSYNDCIFNNELIFLLENNLTEGLTFNEKILNLKGML